MKVRSSLNNTAFTLLEILLSAIIFMISVAGIFATLNAVRAPVIAKENQLAVAVFDQQLLQALYSQVSASQVSPTYYNTCGGSCGGTCATFDLSLGTHTGFALPAGIPSLPPGVANVSYTVSCADGIPCSGASPYCSSNTVAHKVVLTTS